MKHDKKTGEPDSTQLIVRVDLEDIECGKQRPDAAVYAFSSGGKLLDMAQAEPGTETSLRLPVSDDPSKVLIVAGPLLPKDQLKVSELMRRGGQVQHIRVEADKDLESLDFNISFDIWLCWIGSRCSVPGTLIKRQNIDGVWINFPVCNATVEVYEVDSYPLVIDRIPFDALDRIKDTIIDGPIPDGPAIPEPAPGPDPLPFRAHSQFESTAAAASLTEISNELRARIKVANGNELRQLFHEFPLVIRPILCLYFPWLFTMQKLAEAKTDDCGKFRAVFYRGCNNADTPDLYFKAKREFFNFNVTIYEPKPVPCFTHWNYTCGTEVTLYTNHPFAQTCTPCEPIEAEGHWVLVTAIGNLPLSRIRGTSEALDGSTGISNLGLNHALGDATGFDGRPFGGLLRLRMDFDNSLREELDVRYYRVSYRAQGEADGAFVPLDLETHRHYTYEESGEPVIEGYSLGPNVINGQGALFKIPPSLPPKGQWTIADAVEDTTNAKFATHQFVPAAAHGKYELMVELFDAAGNVVNINNVGGQQIRYFVPENQDLSIPGTIHTVSAHGAPLNLVQNVNGNDAFVMTLHIDNNSCTAAISEANIGGSSANACGVLTYGNRSDIVNIPFTALHPNGFAGYRFTVKRGVTSLSSLEMNGQALSPGNFQQSSAVDDLLLEECSMGGFSSHLHVNAWATNGWGEISSYDDNDHAGFALAPDEST